MQQIPVRNVPSTTTAVGGKFHVRLTEGRFQWYRRLISGSLIWVYLLGSLLQYDGRQAILFDFAERRIFLFQLQFTWQDLPILAGLMIIGTVMLFVMAMAWGRVWCGFACPQSIWTWLFIRIEQLTEGDHRVRAKVEKQGLRGLSLFRRISKHLLWVALAWVTAVAFTGYFIPVRDLVPDLLSLEASASVQFWVLVMATLTYLNGGLAREKVCTHMCPYSRFQSVMFDQDTRTVSYDVQRGEPRRGYRSDSEDKGDCVDCNICVQVCPTGIDIRDGLQYECINCAACVDACDQVMEKVGKPKGLIRFASANELEGKEGKTFRPRLLGYASICTLSLAVLMLYIATRSPMIIEISRDRQALYQTTAAGDICNDYLVQFESRASETQNLNLQLASTLPVSLQGVETLTLEPRQRIGASYRVCGPQSEVRSGDIELLVSNGEQTISRSSRFIAAIR